jgi:hypothetical protein
VTVVIVGPVGLVGHGCELQKCGGGGPAVLGRRLVGAPMDKSKEIFGAQHRAYEAVTSTTCNGGAITTDGEVVRCSCRKPPEYVGTHLADEGSQGSERWGASRSSFKKREIFEREPRYPHATDETRSTRSSIVVNSSAMTYSIQYWIFGAVSSFVDGLRE